MSTFIGTPGKSTGSGWHEDDNMVDICCLRIEMTKELYSIQRLKMDVRILY